MRIVIEFYSAWAGESAWGSSPPTASKTLWVESDASGWARSVWTRGPSGFHRAESVGPKRITLGKPTIPASCPGPLSLPMKAQQSQSSR